MDSNLIELINHVVADVELSQGRPADWVITNSGKPAVPAQRKRPGRSAPWSKEEDEYLQNNRPYMSQSEIARNLGRSEYAVKVRATRMGFTSARHAPGYISANKIARLLNVDGHKPPTWIDLGILEGEHFPYPGRICRRVTISVFKRWLIKPISWVYFDVKRMQPGPLRRLVEKAQIKWGDEWLTTRQAGDILGCDPKTIYQQIKMGRIYGYRAIGQDRRRVFGWAHWYVLRSEIEQLIIPRGKGFSKAVWSPSLDATILRMRDDEGLEFTVIAQRLRMKVAKVSYRYHQLKDLFCGGKGNGSSTRHLG